LISSFYNCLNSSIPDGVKDVVRSFHFNGAKVQHAREEEILFQEVKISFLANLRERYSAERTLEHMTVRKEIEADNGELRKKLLKDMGRPKNTLDSEKMRSDCMNAGLNLIKFTPLYHLKRELFKDLLEKSCSDI
jgi:molybdopterin converting factor small subunit